MRDETSWDFFFRTGLPEAYLLAKQREKKAIQSKDGTPVKQEPDA